MKNYVLGFCLVASILSIPSVGFAGEFNFYASYIDQTGHPFSLVKSKQPDIEDGPCLSDPDGNCLGNSDEEIIQGNTDATSASEIERILPFPKMDVSDTNTSDNIRKFYNLTEQISNEIKIPESDPCDHKLLITYNEKPASSEMTTDRKKLTIDVQSGNNIITSTPGIIHTEVLGSVVFVLQRLCENSYLKTPLRITLINTETTYTQKTQIYDENQKLISEKSDPGKKDILYTTTILLPLNREPPYIEVTTKATSLINHLETNANGISAAINVMFPKRKLPSI